MLLSFLKTLRKIHCSAWQKTGISYLSSASDSACSCEVIPDVDVYENDKDTCINIRDFCCGRKVILFGLPGAFTPICSASQLPGFINKAEEFKKLGVDEIACISVNDPYVMCAWGKQHNAEGKDFIKFQLNLELPTVKEGDGLKENNCIIHEIATQIRVLPVLLAGSLKNSNFTSLAKSRLVDKRLQTYITMRASVESHQDEVRMFADTNADLTVALGLDIELPYLGGIRSKRYSMVVTDTKIKTKNIEPDGTGLSISSAECLVV